MHFLYVFVGTVINYLALFWWNLRDRISPPKSDAIVFAAHPDDEVLFFHLVLEEKKPYVVVLFTGWSIKRFFDFCRVMKHYGCRHRIYPTISSDATDHPKRRNKTMKNVTSCLHLGHFQTVFTHNATGEYGHLTHCLTHEIVFKACKELDLEVFCPVPRERIENFHLSESELKSKKYVFDHLYRSEAWVMTEEKAGTPVWFQNERLERMG